MELEEFVDPDLEVDEDKVQVEHQEDRTDRLENRQNSSEEAEVTDEIGKPPARAGVISASEEKISDSYIAVEGDIPRKLAQGFLSTFAPEGEWAKTTLEELQRSQKVLIETVQHEKSKFTECKAFQDLSEMMGQARQYYNKLITVKKEMAAMHEKSTKLKRRALRLQQQKQKEMLQMEQKRERELEKERRLVARPAKRSSSEPKDKGSVV